MGFINACLRDREFRSLMMHQYGSLVLGASRNLLTRSRIELMEPLGYLTQKMEGECDGGLDTALDWAKLKRDQRVRILREYWERVRRKRQRMQELAKLFPRGKANPNHTIIKGTEIISLFAEPFSAQGQERMEFNDKLREIRKTGLSRLLPWRQILSSEIRQGRTRLEDTAPVIIDPKKDTIFKFQQLLEFAHEQKVELSQEVMFGEIHIKPIAEGMESDFTLKDRMGQEYLIDWSYLTENQRKKIVTDLQQRRVLLV